MRREQADWRYARQCIGDDGGYLRVDSTCEPEPSGGRVSSSSLSGCEAKWKALFVPRAAARQRMV